MAKAPKTYRKLPGSGSMAFQWVRLFMGPDHLLQVTSNGFSESYQRFFFSDIQAISCRRNVAWIIWSGVWTALAGLFLTIGLAAGDDALLPLSIVAGFWLGVLGFNLYLGPTCTCILQTAVQTQRLPSIKRVRRVRQILQRLAPLLAEAQGTVDADTLLRRLDPAAAVYSVQSAAHAVAAPLASAPAAAAPGPGADPVAGAGAEGGGTGARPAAGPAEGGPTGASPG